jgi:hypothetical protein
MRKSEESLKVLWDIFSVTKCTVGVPEEQERVKENIHKCNSTNLQNLRKGMN